MTGTVVRDCAHPRAGHKHGTYLAFLRDGCRCEPCTMASRKNDKMTAYRTATGTHSYVDAAPAREHVLALLETLTVGQIEGRSGVHRTAIRVLVGQFPGRPASKRITRRTAGRLLAVKSERVGPEQHGLVDATGTRRRLQALVALGYPMRHLQERISLSSRTVWYICNAPTPQEVVRVSLRDRVCKLYDDLSMTPPTPGRVTTRSSRRAAERGWLPPLAWDDDTIDDPAAMPHLDGVARTGGGRPPADLDEWKHLVLAGENPVRAARRCGVGVDAIEQQARRTDRADVLQLISRSKVAA